MRTRIFLVGVVACVAALLAATSVVFARAGGSSQLVAQTARTAGYGAPGPGSSLLGPSGKVVGHSTLVGGARGSRSNSPGSGLVSADTQRNSPSTATDPDTGTLPFTGLDLLLVAVIGAGLLVLGVRLRSSAGRNATAPS
jgi:hypothetical protein